MVLNNFIAKKNKDSKNDISHLEDILKVGELIKEKRFETGISLSTLSLKTKISGMREGENI